MKRVYEDQWDPLPLLIICPTDPQGHKTFTQPLSIIRQQVFDDHGQLISDQRDGTVIQVSYPQPVYPIHCFTCGAEAKVERQVLFTPAPQADLSGTNRIGEISLVPKEIFVQYGLPHQRWDKEGERQAEFYLFRHHLGALFTLYDVSGELASPWSDLDNDEEMTLHIGGHSTAGLAEFIAFIKPVEVTFTVPVEITLRPYNAGGPAPTQDIARILLDGYLERGREDDMCHWHGQQQTSLKVVNYP